MRSPGRASAEFLIGLVVLVLWSHAWMAELPFMNDDWRQVGEATRLDGPALLLANESGDPEQGAFIRFFRPLLHLSFWAELKLFGPDPRAFHLSSIAHHLVACGLLFAVLKRVLPEGWRGAATPAAWLFAIHPGKTMAVSWVAARGDVLMTIFTLLAVLALVRWRRRGGRAAVVALFAALVAAQLVKEGAVVVPVALVALDVMTLRGLGGPRGMAAAVMRGSVLLVSALHLGARHLAFGEAAGHYAGHGRSMTVFVLERMLASFGPLTRDFVVGSYYLPDDAPMTDALRAVACGVAALAGMWYLRRWRRAQALASLVAVLAILIAPALRFLHEGARTYGASRLLYLPGVVICVALALPLVEITRARRGPRLLAAALVILLGVLALFAHGTHRRVQGTSTRIANEVDRVVRSVVAEESGPPVVLIQGLPGIVDHIPPYGFYLPWAFRPPFTDQPIAAQAVRAPDSALVQQLIARRTPLSLLRWDGPRRALRPIGRTVESPRVPPPAWRAGPLATGESVTLTDVRARECAVLELELGAGAAPGLEAHLIARGAGAPLRIPIRHAAAYGPMPSRLFLYPGRRLDWAVFGEVTEMALEGPAGSLSVTSIRAGALPAIAIVGPDDGARVSLAGPEPTFRFRDPAGSAAYRLSIRDPFRWDLVVRREDCEVVDGVVGIRLSTPDAAGRPAAFRWAARGPSSAVHVFERMGVTTIPLYWKIEGLGGHPDNGPQAASPSRRLIVVP